MVRGGLLLRRVGLRKGVLLRLSLILFGRIKKAEVLIAAAGLLAASCTVQKGLVPSRGEGLTHTAEGVISAALTAATKATPQITYAKLPLHFEPNQGQTNGHVRFLKSPLPVGEGQGEGNSQAGFQVAAYDTGRPPVAGAVASYPVYPGPSERITLHAAGRGNPWINLRDGVDLPTTYTGAAAHAQAVEQSLAQPLAMASADFDEDGVPDLVCGYAGPNTLTLHRGNVDAIYPNSPEAQQRKAKGTFTDLPFLLPARTFEMPEGPEFLGTGDFDNGGHWDVVAAVRGSEALYLLPGDGRGGFGTAKHIQLPGAVTTLATGEINRRDGLDDVVVGIVGPDGPQVLVFEGPEGALRGKPEVFALPTEATALALGQLDDSYEMDLAVAAGRELLIVHGRDRKLSLDAIRRATVPPAAIDHRALPFAITSLALGDFIWDQDYRTEIALLSEDGTVHLLEQEGTEMGRYGEGVTWQWSEAASVSVSPRPPVSASSMMRARVSVGPTDDLVVIDRVNHQLHILMGDVERWKAVEPAAHVPTSPRLHVAASLDAESEPMAVLPMRLNVDALSDLVILKSGPSPLTVAATAASATFTVVSTGDKKDCTPNDGICLPDDFDSATNKCVNTEPCTLRAAIEQADASAGADAINFTVTSISPGSGLPQFGELVTIDGTTSPTGRVELNGTSAGSTIGLDIFGGSTVRGLVINRFSLDGISIGSGNVVEGNFIGTDVTGTTVLGNRGGVTIWDASNNTIGGTAAEARNVISGNSIGIDGNVATGNLVQGNFIGTDVTGTADLGNSQRGVSIGGVGSTGNTIGGTTPGARNVISNHIGENVWILVGATGNLVQGNFIGTDVTGTVALGNSDEGVEIDGSGNTIGGTAGTTPGGPCTGACNVISGNGQQGVFILSNEATGNLVQGNFIGTDVMGTTALGNGDSGVLIHLGSDNTIGGTTSGTDNTIAFNGRDGVDIDQSVIGNAILSNSIFSNTGLGIDLGRDGVTPNDPGDGDTGANNLQNFPVLTG